MVQQTLGIGRSSRPPAQAQDAAPPRSGHLFENTSLARQPELYPEPTAAPAEPRAPEQGVLFTAHEVRRGEQFRTKVVSLDDYRQAPARPKRRAATRTRPTGRALPPQEVEAQRNLFSEPLEAPIASAAALPEASLHCDAVVAPRVQRATAVVLDFVMVTLAVGLVLAGLSLSPLAQYLNRDTLAGMAAFYLAMTIGYKLMFALAESDTPGTRWAGLKLLNFDGHTPRRNERLARLAGGLLSLAAAGLGLLWALVDEETLGWQDHISKTFASPLFAHRR